MSDFRDKMRAHFASNKLYRQSDLLEHLADPADEREFKRFAAIYKNKPMRFFSGVDNEWQAFVAPIIQMEAIQYGLVQDMPEGLITTVGEEGVNATIRFVWKSEGIEDYNEGEPFNETYLEGATAITKWRKPGAKICNTYEAVKDLPLSLITMNTGLTLNEFKAREWKHFTHELHKSTSNSFKPNATDKHGNKLDIPGWRTYFDNAYTSDQTTAWKDIKMARQKMVNRPRDAVRPNVCIINATTETTLSDDDKVNLAYMFGDAGTYWREGKMPSIYGLSFVVVPDAFFGYFTDDTSRKNNQFVTTNDIILTTTTNGPTIVRYNREPLTTEAWRIYEGQKEALNIWERYNYGAYRFTNLMRVTYPHKDLTGATVTLA